MVVEPQYDTSDMPGGSEESKECDCCRFPASHLNRTPFPVKVRMLPGEESVLWCCDLCNGTMTSNRHYYRESGEDSELMKTICYVGNAIMEALAELKEK